MRHQMEAERGKRPLRSALISPTEEPCCIPGWGTTGNIRTRSECVHTHTHTISASTLVDSASSAEDVHNGEKVGDNATLPLDAGVWRQQD